MQHLIITAQPELKQLQNDHLRIINPPIIFSELNQQVASDLPVVTILSSVSDVSPAEFARLARMSIVHINSDLVERRMFLERFTRKRRENTATEQKDTPPASLPSLSEMMRLLPPLQQQTAAQNLLDRFCNLFGVELLDSNISNNQVNDYTSELFINFHRKFGSSGGDIEACESLRGLCPYRSSASSSETPQFCINMTAGCDQDVRLFPAQQLVLKVPHEEKNKVLQEKICCDILDGVIPVPERTVAVMDPAVSSRSEPFFLLQSTVHLAVNMHIITQAMAPFVHQDQLLAESSSSAAAQSPMLLLLPPSVYLQLWYSIGKMIATMHDFSCSTRGMELRSRFNPSSSSRSYSSGFTEFVAPPQDDEEQNVNDGEDKQHSNATTPGSFSSEAEFMRKSRWAHDRVKYPTCADRARHDADELFKNTGGTIFNGDKEKCVAVLTGFHEHYDRLLVSGVQDGEKSVLIHQDVAPSNILIRSVEQQQQQQGQQNEEDLEASCAASRWMLLPVFIDFGDSRYGLREAEFATLFQCFYGTTVWPRILAGYEEHASRKLNVDLVFCYGVARCLWTTEASSGEHRRELMRRYFVILEVELPKMIERWRATGSE